MMLIQKMAKALKSVRAALDGEPAMVASVHYFHRTKKYAFSVKAERLGKDGLLPGERGYQDEHTISDY